MKRSLKNVASWEIQKLPFYYKHINKLNISMIKIVRMVTIVIDRVKMTVLNRERVDGLCQAKGSENQKFFFFNQ